MGLSGDYTFYCVSEPAGLGLDSLLQDILQTQDTHYAYFTSASNEGQWSKKYSQI